MAKVLVELNLFSQSCLAEPRPKDFSRVLKGDYSLSPRDLGVPLGFPTRPSYSSLVLELSISLNISSQILGLADQS